MRVFDKSVNGFSFWRTRTDSSSKPVEHVCSAPATCLMFVILLWPQATLVLMQFAKSLNRVVLSLPLTRCSAYSNFNAACILTQAEGSSSCFVCTSVMQIFLSYDKRIWNSSDHFSIPTYSKSDLNVLLNKNNGQCKKVKHHSGDTRGAEPPSVHLATVTQPMLFWSTVIRETHVLPRVRV